MANNMQQRLCATSYQGLYVHSGLAVPIDLTFTMKDRFASDIPVVHGISVPISWGSPPLLISR